MAQNYVATILLAYENHAASAYSIARRVTRNHELATEAVQDAFLCLWRTRAAYQTDRGGIGPYLHTIVHRRAVDLVRQDVRRPRPLALHLLAEQLSSSDAGPEEHVCRAEEFDRVRSAVLRLSPDRQRPLVMAYYDGLTQPEIAGRLGWSLGTVKTRILAAKRDLRRLLAAELSAGVAER